ncbi:hypothetical protein [Ornithinimicrobium kibberense]|uniref:hypothetical protein n=1 Tax=Ornithinimicrobium kibberense TaxID=282060 RepID=UPI0036215CC9
MSSVSRYQPTWPSRRSRLCGSPRGPRPLAMMRASPPTPITLLIGQSSKSSQ